MNEQKRQQIRRENAIVHIWIFLKLRGYKTVQNLLERKK